MTQGIVMEGKNGRVFLTVSEYLSPEIRDIQVPISDTVILPMTAVGYIVFAQHFPLYELGYYEGE